MSGLRKECKIAMKMSFSGKVKEELASQLSPARHCQIAEFAALFALCGKIRHRKNGSIYLEVHTENLTVARKSYILIKMAFQAETQIRIRNHKAYHLEIAVLSESFCLQLQQIVASFQIEAKIVDRKKYHVLYVKEGSMIVDTLNVMEAHQALMDFENVRILKEVRNSVNRQVNCETANIHKTVTAAARQIEDIQYIETAKGVRWLSDGLREIAELRLEYPDLPLAELGQKLSKPLGKSGVNHRLRKLSEIAERLRAEQEISLKPKEERS